MKEIICYESERGRAEYNTEVDNWQVIGSFKSLRTTESEG